MRERGLVIGANASPKAAPTSRRGIAAGGSLEPHVAAPSEARRIRLWIEINILFIAVPLVMKALIYKFQLPVFLVLQPILLAVVLFLLWDRTFDLRREFTRGFETFELVSILIIFLVAGGIIAAFVAETLPHKFLAMPRNSPDVWQKVMLFYPLLSVLAQEIYYRTFFFHRYGPLFGGNIWRLILVNGMLFGFGHILFGNLIAVAGSFLIGVLLAYRYAVTRSIWAVLVEHTLWGWMVYTIGLGGYFFTGVSAALLR